MSTCDNGLVASIGNDGAGDDEHDVDDEGDDDEARRYGDG